MKEGRNEHPGAGLEPDWNFLFHFPVPPFLAQQPLPSTYTHFSDLAFLSLQLPPKDPKSR